jgi:hypothetical protein
MAADIDFQGESNGQTNSGLRERTISNRVKQGNDWCMGVRFHALAVAGGITMLYLLERSCSAVARHSLARSLAHRD